MKHSTKEISSGGVSARSNRSEDEVFSDAVAEFSDNGFSSVNEEQLKTDAIASKHLIPLDKCLDISISVELIVNASG